MIHECYRIEGFDAEAFRALVTLMRPTRATRPDAASRERTGLLVVVVDDDGTVLGAAHSRRGRLPPISTARDPEALAHVHRAARVVVLREGALEDLAERIALRVRPDQDYLAQLFMVVESLRELERARVLVTYPGTLARVPLPGADAVRSALQALAGDGEAFVLCLHDEKRLSEAFAFRLRDGAVDALIGPRAIERWTGPLPDGFEAGHDAVVAAVGREFAKVRFGLSLRRGVARKLLFQRSPGALSAAIAARDVMARPAPGILSVGVGLDTLASAAYGLNQAIAGSAVIDALAAVFHAFSGESGVPGRAALESWLELFATRVRR